MSPETVAIVPAHRHDVALIGDMCVDLLLSGNVRPRFGQVEQLVTDCAMDVGGSANIFACQTARLGLDTAVIGRVGADALGTLVRSRMQECGVDTTRILPDRGLRTGIGVHLCEPRDRAILTFEGSIAATGPEDLPENPAALTRHWHVASPYLLTPLAPHWAPFLARARAQGVTLSLDPNWDPAEEWVAVIPLLPLLDLLFVNEAEVCAIAAQRDPETAARQLARHGPTVVVKQGPAGAFALKGEVLVRLGDVTPVADLNDSVGAGDSFDAGYLAGWLRGWPMLDCLRLAHRCAAASLTEAGGVAGQLSAQDVDFMEGTKQ